MKTKQISRNQMEMSTISSLPQSKSSGSLNGHYSNNGILPSLKISISNNAHPTVAAGDNQESVTKVSDWYDTDGHRTFMKTVKSGDIVELRNSRTSHWGIAIRLKQPPSPNGKKQEPDEVMIYHLIHSPKNRGQVGQFTIEEFWLPECRIRINNTTNGMCLYGKTRTIPKADVLDHAFTAHMSTTLKWQTCCDFIRWTCEEETHPHLPSSKSSSSSSHVKEN